MILSLRGGGYEYVDLGLPSGLKWAKCNVGAEKETDYGYYFQWGETTPDTNCTWGTYEHCNRSETTLRKYNTSSSYGENPDNTITLETEDDAATQIMGGDWRMPTEAEIQELLDNTTNEWTQVNGVNGRKLTSKTDKSKYIFIPAAGECFYGSMSTVGNNGHIWSSSLYTSKPSGAWRLEVGSFHCAMAVTRRSNGIPVRGVFK